MKLKKIITMGLAAIMAISAMSISAFACENEEDAVAAFLASDGESYIYLSEEDIADGNDEVVGYEGMTFKVAEQKKSESKAASLFALTTSYDFYFTRTTKPTLSNTESIYNTTLTGQYSNIASGTQRFTNKCLLNEDNTSVLMSVSPTAAYNKKVQFSLCAREVTTSPLVSLSPQNNNTYSVSVTGLTNDWSLYCYLNNQFGSAVTGTVSISGYN